MITKQQLENAARAMGLQEIGFMGGGLTHVVNNQFVFWEPEQPTTQGKADLMDLMLALNIQYKFLDKGDGTPPFELIAWFWDGKADAVDSDYIQIVKGNKHAALAEAAVSVASQIWESKND
jgi:hypothetical protein